MPHNLANQTWSLTEGPYSDVLNPSFSAAFYTFTPFDVSGLENTAGIFTPSMLRSRRFGAQNHARRNSSW